MDKLMAALAEKGIAAEALAKMEAAQVKNLAKAFGMNVHEFMPRTVKIEVGRNGAQYVCSEGFEVCACN